MTAEELYRKLREADPASSRRMAGLELGPAEAALAVRIVAEPRAGHALETTAAPRSGAARPRESSAGSG